MAVILALLAAAANALATVLQRIGVEEAGQDSGSLMANVVRRPIWFAGLSLTTASFLLQAVALSVGDLSTVQPVMVTEILFLLLILGLWFRQTLGWREWLGAAGTATGLGVFLAVSAATPGHERPGRLDWFLLLTATAGGVVVSTLAAQRGPRAFRAAAYGVGGGVSFALTAAFIKMVAVIWPRGIVSVATHWQTYGIAVTGLLGLVLAQHALEAGPVAASQSALLVANPISSIVMGVWLFGDHLHAEGSRLPVELAGLSVMFAFLLILASSPLIAAGTGEQQLSAGRPPLGQNLVHEEVT